jgi:integrase
MEKERPVPCSPKTLARRITSTKSFFRWLHQYGVLLVDPAEKVLQRSVMSPLPTVLTEEEVQAVLQAADSTATSANRMRARIRWSICCCQPVSRRASAWVSTSTTLTWKRRRPAGLYPLCQPVQPLQGTQNSIA